MKISIISNWHADLFVSRGYHLAKHLAELGDEVHYITWDPHPTNVSAIKTNLSSSLKYAAHIKDGVVVHKIRRLPFFFPPINGYMFRQFLARLSKREGLDAIISASMSNELEPPFDLPLIYDFWDHQEIFWDMYAGPVSRFGMKHVLNQRKTIHTQVKHAGAATAVSDILVNYAKKINPDIPVYKIPNGVDSLFLETSLAPPQDKLGKYSMAYESVFGEYANLPKLIEATKLLKASYPDIRLMLAGDGVSVPAAKELVGSLGLSEQVTFLGRVPREKLPSIINRCEIGLCPFVKNLYTDSAFPIKIMEYTALGKRIVSSDLEEVKLLGFPNITLYDESKGVEQLANAIITAFNADTDQRGTRKLASRYTWRSIAQQFRGVLQEVVAQRNA